ncbi:methylamine utilization protein [Rhodopirellula sp.]|nr:MULTISPECIES: methylamine utilization protein [Pirellulaceae]MDB4338600.1 methylamine utilization protein [Rubripirellula sp.]MDB4678940.1 methylamine utilization protein [Rhodopirellula sp.]
MIIKKLSIAVLLLFASVSVSAAETGDLKIRFEYGGDAPKQVAVNVTADGAFCGKQGLLDESLIVNAEDKGLQNVVVQVYTGRGGSKLDSVEPSSDEITLDNDSCRFEPHVVIAQVGDTLKVTNSDAVGHNANLQFFNNAAKNPMIPPNQDVKVELTESEPGIVEVRCNIHPWMKALLLVLDHPYASVSNASGELVIKGIPVGEHTFRVNHESARIGEVSVNGETEKWSRSRFELEIKPGMNDMGTIVIPSDAFSAN